MKILVTGATGFVGKNLVKKLKNYDFKIIVRRLTEEYPIDQQIIYDINKLKDFKLDVELYNPDIAIHLASHVSSSDNVDSIISIVNSNILFTSILFDALRTTDLLLFVNTGTFAEYYFNDGIENPSYFYAASKTATRSIIKYFKNMYDFKYINIIPYTIYGGDSRAKKVIDFIVDSTRVNTSIDMTGGEQILDFIHIEDVVDFYIHCIKNTKLIKDESIYHLGTGKGTSIKEVANIIEKVTSKKTNINWGAIEYRPLDIMRSIAPVYKLEKELNWKPKISIEDGIIKMLQEKEICL